MQVSNIQLISDSQLSFNGKIYRCAIGKNGFIKSEDKKEGDLCTPVASMVLRECWVRKDRVIDLETKLKVINIQADDGWCDEPSHELYNKPVKLPFEFSHEKMLKQEHVYDIIVPLGYNDSPPVSGKGSAIFFHLAREDYAGTEGCVAVSLPDMLEILAAVEIGCELSVVAL